LQENERYKQAAVDLDELPRMERDLLPTSIEVPDRVVEMRHPDVDMRELLLAMQEVMRRAELFSQHHVQMEPLSMRERMSIILETVSSDSFVQFHELFTLEEGRMGVVVTFLAMLELLKDTLIEIVQAEPFGPIHIKAIES
jgi:segregation and condensation protein A